MTEQVFVSRSAGDKRRSREKSNQRRIKTAALDREGKEERKKGAES
jgi:hypothetical protein